MKKILLKAYLAYNFGDDLFLKILFDRYPNVNWVLAEGGERYINLFKKYPNVKVKNGLFFKILRRLGRVEKNDFISKYDAGLYIGGSIFMELPVWREQLEERQKIITSFYDKNKPYFILGSNFGPYKDPMFLTFYEELLQKCKDVCFRDKFSYDLFSKYSNSRLAPDIVFQLKPQNIKKEKNSLGISLINLKERGDLPNLEKYKSIYYTKLKEIIEKSILKDKSIYLFSFCEDQGDMIAIRELMDYLPENIKQKVNIISYDGDIDKFLIDFERMENIIGTRFHACILSQVFNQGLYPIIYSNKTYNVLKDIKLDKECTFINELYNLDVDHVLNIISENKIVDTQFLKDSEKHFKELDKYVKK